MPWGADGAGVDPCDRARGLMLGQHARHARGFTCPAALYLRVLAARPHCLGCRRLMHQLIGPWGCDRPCVPRLAKDMPGPAVGGGACSNPIWRPSGERCISQSMVLGGGGGAGPGAAGPGTPRFGACLCALHIFAEPQQQPPPPGPLKQSWRRGFPRQAPDKAEGCPGQCREMPQIASVRPPNSLSHPIVYVAKA
jgi:hypothetical protein